jgi:hypothetical protein
MVAMATTAIAQGSKQADTRPKATAGRYTLTLVGAQPAQSNGTSTFGQFPGGAFASAGGFSGSFSSSGSSQQPVNRTFGSNAGPAQSGVSLQFSATAPNKDELLLIEGIEPGAIAVDDKGHRSQSHKGFMMPDLLGVFQSVPGERKLSAFVPIDKDVKSLQFLEGNLVVSQAKVDKAMFQTDDLKPGAKQRIGDSTVVIDSVESNESGVSVNVTITSPSRRPNFQADPREVMEMLRNMSPKASATLYGDDESEYKPVATSGGGGSAGGSFSSNFSSSSSSSRTGNSSNSSQRSGSFGDPNSMTSKQSFTFAPLLNGGKPAGLSINVVTRTGTTRLPFRFTNLNLPADR